MPLYEYVCDACGKHFELIRKFSDPPVETCFSCGGPVRKLLSSPAIQFKGSGWYVTDYARKGQTPASESSSSTNSTKSDKSEKSDKSDKSEKSDKSDKSEKSEKSDSSKPPST